MGRIDTYPPPGAVSDLWIPYTPQWSTWAGTQPSLGNGVLKGRYKKDGRTVDGQMLFQAGSTTTFGTGAFMWSLPLTAAAGFSGYGWQICGTVECWNADVAQNFNTNCRITGFDASNNKLSIAYPSTWPAGPELFVTFNQPWTWAVSDEISFWFMYEAVT
jgi:hypothetical protein